MSLKSYDLFNKYRSDYQVEEILAGNTTEEIKERVGSAGFDERLSLIGLLLDAVTDEVKIIINGKKEMEQLMQILKQFRVLSTIVNGLLILLLAILLPIYLLGPNCWNK